MHSPHYGTLLVHGIAFDAAAGIGCPRPRRAADASDVYVAMRPSIFLQLASPLIQPRPSLRWLQNQIAAGRSICPPSLGIHLPGGRSATVVRHDGRHRATIMREWTCDAEMPVQIDLLNGQVDDLTDAVVARLRAGMRRQKDGLLIAGPLFGLATIEGRVVDRGDDPALPRVYVLCRARAGPRFRWRSTMRHKAWRGWVCRGRPTAALRSAATWPPSLRDLVHTRRG